MSHKGRLPELSNIAGQNMDYCGNPMLVMGA